MEATARVIPWTAKPQVAKEPPVSAGLASEATVGASPEGRFAPLGEFLVTIPDEQLHALGAIFMASPLRKAMTFEAYLVTKGFGQPAS